MKVMGYVVFAVGLLSTAAFSQVGPWKLTMNTNLLVSLNTYSDNWTGGESGAFSWAAKLDAEAAKQISDKLNTRNTMKLAFGQTKMQDTETKDWGAFAKSTDKIELETFWRLTLGALIDPFLSVRLESQFFDISDATNERYMNPLNLTETMGASSQLAKNNTIDWIARLGLGGRQLIDRDALQADSTYETERNSDAGAEFVTDLKVTNTAKWLIYTSSLRVYEALVSTKDEETVGTDSEGDWRFPDITWQNNLVLNITKYVMLNFYVEALYDKEIDTDVRLKQTMSLGLTYTATNGK